MEAPREKKQYTDEERLELAAKLDKELDEFINNLPKKRYEDGWPEDRWEDVKFNQKLIVGVIFELNFCRKWKSIRFS